MSTSDYAVKLNNVHFQYSKSNFHLNIPHFQIKTGQKIALLGPSGTGKTTLLHLICGIQQANSGKITTLDQNLIEMKDAQRRHFRLQQIGLIFQEFALVDHLNTLDNIVLPYRLSRELILDQLVYERAEHFIRRLDLTKLRERYPRQLSQGEKQRVSIARALITQPKLILADEATANLDPANKQFVIDLVFEQVDQLQGSLLVVTHDYEYLDRFDASIQLKDIGI